MRGAGDRVDPCPGPDPRRTAARRHRDARLGPRRGGRDLQAPEPARAVAGGGPAPFLRRFLAGLRAGPALRHRDLRRGLSDRPRHADAGPGIGGNGVADRNLLLLLANAGTEPQFGADAALGMDLSGALARGGERPPVLVGSAGSLRRAVALGQIFFRPAARGGGRLDIVGCARPLASCRAGAVGRAGDFRRRLRAAGPFPDPHRLPAARIRGGTGRRRRGAGPVPSRPARGPRGVSGDRPDCGAVRRRRRSPAGGRSPRAAVPSRHGASAGSAGRPDGRRKRHGAAGHVGNADVQPLGPVAAGAVSGASRRTPARPDCPDGGGFGGDDTGRLCRVRPVPSGALRQALAGRLAAAGNCLATAASLCKRDRRDAADCRGTGLGSRSSRASGARHAFGLDRRR